VSVLSCALCPSDGAVLTAAALLTGPVAKGRVVPPVYDVMPGNGINGIAGRNGTGCNSFNFHAIFNYFSIAQK